MKLLNKLSDLQVRAIPTSLALVILFIALIGFADSAFLAFKHFQNVVPPCTLTSGCEAVLTSQYSELAGIPVALLGALYYLAILIGLFTYIESKNTKVLKWTLVMTIFGFVFSVWLVILQVFIIKSLCMYCLISALTSTLLFLASIYVFSRHRDTATLPA